jgi:hypothetical protein
MSQMATTSYRQLTSDVFHLAGWTMRQLSSIVKNDLNDIAGEPAVISMFDDIDREVASLWQSVDVGGVRAREWNVFDRALSTLHSLQGRAETLLRHFLKRQPAIVVEHAASRRAARQADRTMQNLYAKFGTRYAATAAEWMNKIGRDKRIREPKFVEEYESYVESIRTLQRLASDILYNPLAIAALERLLASRILSSAIIRLTPLRACANELLTGWSDMAVWSKSLNSGDGPTFRPLTWEQIGEVDSLATVALVNGYYEGIINDIQPPDDSAIAQYHALMNQYLSTRRGGWLVLESFNLSIYQYLDDRPRALQMP